ncbi:MULTISPECIES: CsbD family protein [Roseobacter]|uniref:CsbD-like protein n=1 Tax=Roseobacter litoralis (strain ATCC 49566 / DSM 6996 / JCM 21268 / NBRC 15278 / OCh 149) TaxID=391595 RepID=F7ZIF9_ROSLO|nr:MULTISPECIES: CsbD family protein [Roseobacter]AEI92478.1 CsbD-like protein [Roseobacter litoralis Och 149]GIT87665.1 CsbD family protein [Roseobacter sp. OBYS 0001]
MNWDVIKGNWSQMTGEIKSQWGDLTDDEIQKAAGERERFVGLIQERYGLAKSDAEVQVDKFLANLKDAA